MTCENWHEEERSRETRRDRERKEIWTEGDRKRERMGLRDQTEKGENSRW